MDLALQVKQLVAASEPEGPALSGADVEQLAQVARLALGSGQTEALAELLQEAEARQGEQIRQLGDSGAFDAARMAGQLDRMNGRATRVRAQAQEVAQRMAGSSGRLVEKASALARARRTRENLAQTLQTVRLCLQALGHVNQVQELLKSSHRVAAVHNLRELQRIDLAELRAVGLGPLLAQTVPALQREIAQATLGALGDYLAPVSMQRRARAVGDRAFELLAAQRAAWDALCRQSKHLKAFRFNSPVELAYRRSNNNYLTDAALGVDLAPIFEADMVFTRLERSSELGAYLDAHLADTNDALCAPVSLPDLLAQLATIVGFCLFDRVLSNVLPALRPAKSVDDGWEKLSQSITRTVTGALGAVGDAGALKQQLGGVMAALQNYDFNVASISDLFKALLAKQCAATIEQLRARLREHRAAGEPLQMVVTSHSGLEHALKTAWYEHADPDPTLPAALPFSESYCIVCGALRVLLDHGASFLDQFQNDPGFVEERVVRAIDAVLKDAVDSLKRTLKSANRELVVQALVDAKMFVYAAAEIERQLARMRAAGGRRGSVLLESAPALQKVYKEAETKIYVLLEETVLEFFTGGTFDWTAEQPQDSPSANVLEMTTYLLTMANTVLKRLPPDVRSLAYFNLAENINTGLRTMLYAVPPQVTPVALANFELDLNFLENGLGQVAPDSTDSMPLLESRQLLELLRADDAAQELSNPQIRMRKYDRLSLSHASQLVRRVADQRAAPSPQLGPKPSIMRRYLGSSPRESS